MAVVVARRANARQVIRTAKADLAIDEEKADSSLGNILSLLASPTMEYVAASTSLTPPACSNAKAASMPVHRPERRPLSVRRTSVQIVIDLVTQSPTRTECRSSTSSPANQMKASQASGPNRSRGPTVRRIAERGPSLSKGRTGLQAAAGGASCWG